MQNDYECPRCHNVFPSSNKIMHDIKCTEQNPLPINQNNNVEPPHGENKEEHIPQLSELINNVNIENGNNNISNNHINNNDSHINNHNNINNNFDFNFYDNNINNNNNNNNFNNDDFNFNFYDNNNNNLNNNLNNNNNNNDDFHLDAFNNINEPPKDDDFPETFECDICHQTLLEKERNDHMLCHNLEKEDKKNAIRISRIDIEEQKKIEKQIEKNNRRRMIRPHRINQNQNNFNINNNIDDINNNIPNINNNNNNRRNNNNNRIHYHHRINPNNNNNNNNNINLNERMEIRIREGGPNVEFRIIRNNTHNNERINVHRNPRTNNLNNNNNFNINNFPNYEIDRPNNPISFNRQNRARQRIVPFHDINNRFSIRAIFDDLYSNLDNNNHHVRATDREILNNLPETQIEDVSKLDQEKKNCVICLEDFKNHDKAIILPCIHLFHKNCIKNWLKKKNTCPICKFKLTGSNIESQNNNFQ